MTKIHITVCLGFVALFAALAPGAPAGNGADGSAYQLQSFNGITLVGTNDQGFSFASEFDSSTRLRAARLDLYPTDPIHSCRAAAANYNAALGTGLGDGSQVSAAIGSLAEARCDARVIFTGYPVDPVLPPSPIKSFQPVP